MLLVIIRFVYIFFTLIGIITEDCLSSVEDILKEIQDVLQTPGEDRDGKQLLKLSYDYYCNIPTISPVPSYISSNSELYTKFQILNVC